jgi:phage terminase small subunit
MSGPLDVRNVSRKAPQLIYRLDEMSKATKKPKADKSDAPALTAKQQRFVDEYLIDLNATQAAIRAGYSEKTAYSIGNENLSKPEIAKAIEGAQIALAKRTEITADRVLTELGKLGFSNMQDYMRAGADGDPYLDFSNLTREQAAALAEVTVEDFKDGRGEDARDVRRVKFKLTDKRAALVDIGKHLGMFKDQVEHTGPDGRPIELKHTVEVFFVAAKAGRPATENVSND